MPTTKSPKVKKPKKPYSSYPLFPHSRGQWAKKIDGKTRYFGRWDDPKGALARYEAERNGLYLGPTNSVTVSVGELSNTFIAAKKLLVDSGELTSQHWGDLHRTCRRLIAHFGYHAKLDSLPVPQFEALRANLAKAWAPTTLGPELARMRSIFRYAYEMGLIDQEVKGVRALAAPSRKTLRQHRQKSAQKLYSAEQIRQFLAAADTNMKAFILLGINCGFNNKDCGYAPNSAFDLKEGWVSFARTKTAIDRRCPLWPQTIEAVKNAISIRPKPFTDELADRAFLTDTGRAWALDKGQSPISSQFAKLKKKVGFEAKHVGFSALRHTFYTIGGDVADKVASDFLMGHADNSISDAYRERISDERLLKVTQCVQSWLFGV